MQVNATETLARYIYSKNDYKASNHTVKYSAFIPPKEDGRLSVYRILGLGENEIWEIGEHLRPRALLARADIKATSVSETGLTIDGDDIPFRHAHIVGWPQEDSAKKLKALELAEKARLSVR